VSHGRHEAAERLSGSRDHSHPSRSAGDTEADLWPSSVRARLGVPQHERGACPAACAIHETARGLILLTPSRLGSTLLEKSRPAAISGIVRWSHLATAVRLRAVRLTDVLRMRMPPHEQADAGRAGSSELRPADGGVVILRETSVLELAQGGQLGARGPVWGHR
jgi:hypothetical protein